jgi:uncharacterized protein (TIGR03437 family)
MRRLMSCVMFFALSLLLIPGAQAQTETVTYSYNGGPLQIYTNDANIASLATITVPRALKITNVTVRVQVQYSGVGDLNLYLFSPLTTRTKLLERNCGNLVNVDTTFDDAAQSKYADFCPAEAGRGPFRGNEPLSNFKDQVSLGNWTLAVENNGTSKTGWLTQFVVTITGTLTTTPTFVKQTVGNAASVTAGAIAPGEMVGIFGYGLGPSTPASAPAGNWPTTLSGTTVLFDGVQVPIAYASDYLVMVQAPYLLAPGAPTNVQIQRNGVIGSTVLIDVAVTAPGIFTATASGTGQAKVINSDGTLNSKANPAPVGSYIIVYASGLGAVDPPMTAGQMPPSGTLFTTVQAVAASVGGVPAKVSWAGASGYIGIYQVNVLLDQSLPKGTQSLVISAGGSASQQNVTVEIK